MPLSPADPGLAEQAPPLHSYADYLDALEAWLTTDAHAAPHMRQAAPVNWRGGRAMGDAVGASGLVGDGAAAEERPPVPPARRFATGERFVLSDGVPELVVIPPGSFQMGAHPRDPDAQFDERHGRRIVLARPLAVGTAPVTFAQWDACRAADGTRYTPSDAGWGRGDRPVMNVSWHDAEEYVGWLTRITGERWRMLTEAEWEYAFWAGEAQTERFPWSADLGYRQLRHHAWYRDNADNRSHPVGALQPNAWGLCDMLGNVAEWVQDHHHGDLSATPADGRAHQGLVRGASRVFKGGSWLDSPLNVRPSARNRYQPDHRSYRVGFRVAMEVPQGRWADDS